MRNSVASLVFCVFALSACGPKSLPPIVNQGQVNEEQKIQQGLVVKDYLDRLGRVERVSERLLIAMPYGCTETDYRSGVLIMDKMTVWKPYREAMAYFHGLDDRPRVVYVVPGLAADKSGLKADDVVLAINGEAVQSADAATKLLRKHEVVAVKVLRAGQEQTVEITQPKACAYSVHYLETPQINAYATGSNVYVLQGIVKFVKSDDEMAVILGHEMAHNSMKHITSKKTNGFLMSLLIDGPIIALTGVNPGIGRTMGENIHSKDFEAEADYVGMYNTVRAGFNVDGVEELWRRMAVEYPTAVYVATTHPTTAARFEAIKAAREEIAKKQAAGEPLEPNMKPE